MARDKKIFRTYVIPLLTEMTSQFMITFWGSMAMTPYGDGPSVESDDNTTSVAEGHGCEEEYLVNVFMPALQAGLSVWMMVTVFWKISGAHFNPAVSVAMVIAGELRPVMFVPYVIFQCLGSIMAAATAKVILGENPGIIAIPEHVTSSVVFLNEFVVVAMLVFCVLAVCADQRFDQQTGTLAIGMSVFQGILTSRWVGTIGISPSRVIGPAVLVGGKAWSRHWLFWLADLSGGAFAACYYMLFFAPPAKCWMGLLRLRKGAKGNSPDSAELGPMVGSDDEKQ